MKNIILLTTTQQKLFYPWQLVSFIRVNFICENFSRAFEFFQRFYKWYIFWRICSWKKKHVLCI